MKIARLEDMCKGWFIGNFEPSLYKTNDVEVAVKVYKAGDYGAAHYHKIGTEFTAVISGRVRMGNTEYQAGDIIMIEPGEITDFTALTDVVNVVVKLPGANHVKYNAT